MAEKNNATCSICGKDYHKCISCKGKVSAEPWKMYCCSSEHFKVFQVIRGFNTGVYTKDEAKDRLQNINLSDLNKLRDNIKKIIKEVIKEDKKVEKIEESVVQVETVVEVTEEPVVNAPASSYINRRKKSFEQEDSE